MRIDLEPIVSFIVLLAGLCLIAFFAISIIDKTNSGYLILEGYCLDKEGLQDITEHYPEFYDDFKILNQCTPVNCSNKDNFGCYIEVI